MLRPSFHLRLHSSWHAREPALLLLLLLQVVYLENSLSIAGERLQPPSRGEGCHKRVVCEVCSLLLPSVAA